MCKVKIRPYRDPPIVDELVSAFSGMAKPSSVKLLNISNEDADELTNHILRHSDDVQSFYIPKLLVLTLCADIATSRRDQWAYRLVNRLDVGVEGCAADMDVLLRDVKRETFAAYSPAQCRAIYHWLEYVRGNFDCAAFREEIASAVNYWRTRAECD
jgi:hypothetical protein